MASSVKAECRELLRQILRRAYAFNTRHTDCGFVVPLPLAAKVKDIAEDRLRFLRFKRIERCIAAVWPFYVSRYIGNYKRVIYVLGISLEEFKRRAGL